MSTDYKVKVNDAYTFDYDKDAISQLDAVSVETNKFHILHQNKPFHAEIIQSHFTQKSYSVKVNNNTYEVLISDALDQLITEMGFEKGKSKHINSKDGIQTTGVEEIHYFLTAGFVFDLSPSLKFKPAFMAKGVSGAPMAFDVTANVLVNNFIEGGIGYRFDDSVSGLINVHVTPSLRIGYAYDYTLSNLGKYNSGTHEIFLLFDLDFSGLKSKAYDKSPRFF